MQALKGLVVGLGILIVVGFVLLIYGFYANLTKPGFKVVATKGDEASAHAGGSSAPGARPAPRGTEGFGETRIGLPDGCTVVEMRPDGDRLYLRTGPAGLCERILVVDPDSGRVLGTFVVKP
jgi:hypothetical protein